MTNIIIIKDKIDQAIMQRSKGSWKKAVSIFKSIIADNPLSSEAHAHLAQTYVLQRRYEQAIKSFNKALDINENNIFALMHLGKVYCEIGKFNKSLECFNKAKSCEPDEKDLTLIQDWEATALKYVTSIKELGVNTKLPSDEMGVQLYLIGSDLIISGDLKRGVEAYELSAKCRVDYSNPALNIGSTISTHRNRMPEGEYKSCSWLEEGLHFHDDRLTFCCTAHSGNKGWTKIGQFNGGKLPIDLVLAKRALTAHQLIEGEENNCSGCPKLEKKSWPAKEYIFTHLIFNNFSVCNFRCTYCSLTHQNFEMPAYYFSAEQAVMDILDNDWLNPKGTSTWGGGDPTVSREFRGLLHKLVERGSFNIINTNAAIHLPDIEKALKDGKANVMVSIDAGTHQTFDAVKFGNENSISKPSLIKGKLAMDAVWETLNLYIQASAKDVVVKYIVDHNNSTNHEIEEFIKNCIKHNVRKLMVTPEAEFIRHIPITKDILPTHIFECIRYATELAQENNIECLFDPNVYRQEVFEVKKQKIAEQLIAKAI